jgi:WD40 repeat protein
MATRRFAVPRRLTSDKTGLPDTLIAGDDYFVGATPSQAAQLRAHNKHAQRTLDQDRLEQEEFDNMSGGLFGGGGTAATSSSSTPATQGDISRDIALSNPPEDSIQAIKFSPQSNHLSVASWDNKVRIYEINQDGTSAGKALFDLTAPALSTCWSQVCA